MGFTQQEKVIGYLFLLFMGLLMVFAMDSDDVDELCATDDRILMRLNGEWQCALFSNSTTTIINNTIYTNGSNLTGYVPYIGATQTLNLNQQDLLNVSRLTVADGSFNTYNIADIYSNNIMTKNSYTTAGSAALDYSTRIGANFNNNDNYYQPAASALVLKAKTSDSKDYYFIDPLFIEQVDKSGGNIISVAGIYIEPQDAGTDNWGVVSNNDQYIDGGLLINPAAMWFDQTDHPTEALEVRGNATISENAKVNTIIPTTTLDIIGNANITEDLYANKNVYLTPTNGGNTYKVGIGTASPAYQFDIVRSGGGGARGMRIMQYSSNAAAPLFLSGKAYGTEAAPADAPAGVFTYSQFGMGYVNGTFQITTGICGYVEANDGTNIDGALVFSTSQDGIASCTSDWKMDLDSAGDLHLDSGTARSTFYIVDGETAGAGLQIQKSDSALWALNKISGSDSFNIYNYGTSTRSLYIDATTDNIGIGGTTTPSHELNVIGSANVTTDIYVGENITMISPDGTSWECGVDNTGTFSCS